MNARARIQFICFSVPSLSPEALSFKSVFIIWFSLLLLRPNPVLLLVLGTNPVERARSLVRIRTLACGAGGLGFKSPRARHNIMANSLYVCV